MVKFDSKLINDQFKNIKNNINFELDNMINEEENEDYIEDEDNGEGTVKEKLERMPQIVKYNFNRAYAPKQIQHLSTDNDMSNIGDIVLKNKQKKTSTSMEQEVFNFDESNIFNNENIKSNYANKVLTEKEVHIKLENFNSKNSKSTHNLEEGIAPKAKTHVPVGHVINNFNTINISNTYNNTNSNNRKEKSTETTLPPIVSNPVKCTCEESKERSMKYNLHLQTFFQKVKKLCETSVQMVKWIEQSYKWVENRYLKNFLKNINKINEHRKASDDIRFSVQNIPKRFPKMKSGSVKLQSMKKTKNKNNLLKAADNNFKLLLNMIMGIQLAIQSTSNLKININEDLSKYLKTMKYSIQTINFGSKKQETFYIRECAGVIFNNIRKLYNIDKDTFISSISPQDFITEMMISSSTIIEELCSTGKSGSLFYYTRDGRFILKTISHTEYKFLRKILANYFKHLMDNPNTLLPKFMGCYKLVKKVKKSKFKVYFIIMDNIFSTNKEIHLRYDLKGSKIGRQVLKNPKEAFKGLNKLSYALKDIDLENSNQYFAIGEKKTVIIDQLSKDSEFLKKNNIIDYSLLIGINLADNNDKTEVILNNNNMINSNENRKNKFYRTYSPNRLATQKDENRQSTHNKNCNSSHENIEHKEVHSVCEKPNKNFRIDEENGLGQMNSDYSMYNLEMKFSDAESNLEQMELKSKISEIEKHPYKDVNKYFFY